MSRAISPRPPKSGWFTEVQVAANIKPKREQSSLYTCAVDPKRTLLIPESRHSET
jgi:hypothetical protein